MLVAMGTKTARLDLRLTEDQRELIEQASQLAGTTITGWSVARLFDDARRAVADAAVTRVPRAAWEGFVAALDEPWDERTNDLMSRTPVWDAK